MTAADAQGAVRALLILIRETGVNLSVHDASPELLDALGAMEDERPHRYIGRKDGQEWDAISARTLSMYGKHRPIEGACPTCSHVAALAAAKVAL